MQDTKMHQNILGLESHWSVSSVDLNVEIGEIVVKVSHLNGTRFCCPQCDQILIVSYCTPHGISNEESTDKETGRTKRLRPFSTAVDSNLTHEDPRWTLFLPNVGRASATQNQKIILDCREGNY